MSDSQGRSADLEATEKVAGSPSLPIFKRTSQPYEAAAASPATDGGAPDLAAEMRLVSAARSGDASAVEALYKTHYATIYRYVLYRVGSATAAEDVSSQVFLGMVRNLPRYKHKGKPFLAWLYGIAQKQVAMYSRDRARAGAAVDLDQAGPLPADDPHVGAGLEAEERRAQLGRALRMLPESQREVIILRQVLSLSLAETAASLDRSEGAVKQLQMRGLATLKDILAEGMAAD